MKSTFHKTRPTAQGYLETRFGEVNEEFGQCGGEEKRLAMSVRKTLEDLLHLIGETQFKQPVRFIENYVLNCIRKSKEDERSK